MFSKANIISTIVTTIWGFAGGYLLWGLVGDPFMEDHFGSATGIMREVPDMVHLILGCLVQGFAFSTIYRKWGGGTYSASNGLNFGLWVAILIGLGGGLIDFATSNMLDITGTFANALIYLVFFLIMGALVGLIYNKSS